jgi:hypothetical protein
MHEDSTEAANKAKKQRMEKMDCMKVIECYYVIKCVLYIYAYCSRILFSSMLYHMKASSLNASGG